MTARALSPEPDAIIDKIVAAYAATRPPRPFPLYIVEIHGGLMKFYNEPQRTVEYPRGALVVSPEQFHRIIHDPLVRPAAVNGQLSEFIGTRIFHAPEDHRRNLVKDILGL